MIYVTQLQIRSETFAGLGLKFHHQLVSITEQFACQTIKKKLTYLKIYVDYQSRQFKKCQN